MFMRLFLLFTIIPFVEVIILLQLNKWIGLGPTILMVVVSGIIGAFFVKREGLSIWTRLQKELQAGAMPSNEIFNGVLLLVAGIVLITPGLLTDITGYLLIIPPTREMIKKVLIKQFKGKIQTNVSAGGFSASTSNSSFSSGSKQINAEVTDYEVEE